MLALASALGLLLAGCAPIGSVGPSGGGGTGGAGGGIAGTGAATATGATTATGTEPTGTGTGTGGGVANEVPTPAPPEQAPGTGTPAAALRSFATAYVNWSAASVAGDLRGLARASVGQARSAMELAAADAGRDATLRRGGIANHGMVEAVAPETGRPGAYVVVTRESTTASASTAYAGLAPEWHVTVATVTREPDGRWVVSGWQPES